MRSLFLVRILTPLTLAIFLGGQAVLAQEQEGAPTIKTHASPATMRILDALAQETTLDFMDTTLPDVVSFIQQQHNIPVVIDRRALAEAGGGAITFRAGLRGVPLRMGLRLMLRDVGLAYTIEDGVLVITTPLVAAANTELRVYDVTPILLEFESSHLLATTLLQALAPPDVEYRPDPPLPVREIIPYQKLLLVRATTRGHEDLADTLAALTTATKESVELILRRQQQAQQMQQAPPPEFPPDAPPPNAPPEFPPNPDAPPPNLPQPKNKPPQNEPPQNEGVETK